MPFDKVITELHWKQMWSVNRIAKECGISHTPIINLCKLTNLKLRTHSEASSESIKKVNANVLHREKRARTIRGIYSKNILPQEKEFKKYLDALGIKYEMQYPIGPYNIDFFIPNKRLCIEIDSTYKWGNGRIKAADTKDKLLKDKGFTVIRLNKVWLNDLLKLIVLIS